LVDLFKLCDDARTCKIEIPIGNLRHVLIRYCLFTTILGGTYMYVPHDTHCVLRGVVFWRLLWFWR